MSLQILLTPRLNAFLKWRKRESDLLHHVQQSPGTKPTKEMSSCGIGGQELTELFHFFAILSFAQCIQIVEYQH